MRTDLLATLLFATVLCAARTLSAQDRLFVSAQLTPAGEYTSEIEGPAVDAAGNLYAVNLHRAGTIGEFTPGAGTSRLFATLPDGSIGSGIRFDREQRMYVADYRRHNIFVFDLGADTPKLYFHSSDFSQPNDLAMARDGTLFASDPDFARHTGRVWRIDRAADGATGAPMHSARPMGEANGIDLSPDGATLYVSETDTREIWAYRIDGNALTHPRLVVRFPTSKLDGLRTDRAAFICCQAGQWHGCDCLSRWRYSPRGSVTGKIPDQLDVWRPRWTLGLRHPGRRRLHRGLQDRCART